MTIQETIPDNVEIEIPSYKKFYVENITVARAPLLKVYYWESFDINGLNEKLKSDQDKWEHTLCLPTTQINSRPMKVVFWLRNISKSDIELRMRRIQNCDCVPMQTRVGFNQFRHLYHCPHRRLIHILQDHFVMKPDDLVAMSAVAHYFLLGEHKLTYEIICPDKRSFFLNFTLDIIGFDPQKCILNRNLIPIDIREHRRFMQPIWVHNISMQHLCFTFASRDRGLKLINPNLTVPRLSVWPLMAEYRPSDLYNKLDLTINFDSIHTKTPIYAKGIMGPPEPDIVVPTLDYECADFLYVIYPNQLDFETEIDEDRSLLVSIHNFSQKCVEFRWQNYIINDLFEITYEPNVFRLKPHHSKLCAVYLRVFHRPLHFKRIPVVLEVHRNFDKGTKIAKALLDEVESIDDPKWKQDSYITHLFINVNIKVNFPKQNDVVIDWENIQQPFKREQGSVMLRSVPTRTIFEKLYWEYLSQSSFMRENNNPKISEILTYDEVLNMYLDPPLATKNLNINKNSTLRILSHLIMESCQDMAKNWRFVPREFSARFT